MPFAWIISADSRPLGIPAGAPTAQTGQWVPGPGAKFFNAVQRELGGLPFIAEDLGLITPDVYALHDQFRLPGTRALQFAFDGHSDNPYLPKNYLSNTVVYTGTHDNPTFATVINPSAAMLCTPRSYNFRLRGEFPSGELGAKHARSARPEAARVFSGAGETA